MASVHLLSAAPRSEPDEIAMHDLAQMQASARADTFGAHRVLADPARADLILFVETHWAAGHYFQRVREHPVYREFRAKSYLFSSADKVIPFLPGVFASIEARWYRSAWARSGHYIDVKERDQLRFEEGHSPSRLFSFVGATANHPLRRRIMDLRHPDAVLIDATAESAAIERRQRSPARQAEWREAFARSILDCAFVLCPRGGGPSSRRIFEAMMLGRVPVIISDQWVPPQGPDWPSFSLRVGEDRVAAIPALLEARAADATAMGARARAQWLEWFSEAASFHRTVNWCLELARCSQRRRGLGRYEPHLQMLRPYHAARAVAKRAGHGESAGSPYWDRPLHRLRHSLRSARR
jgi:hypothetical protein